MQQGPLLPFPSCRTRPYRSGRASVKKAAAVTLIKNYPRSARGPVGERADFVATKGHDQPWRFL